MVPKNRFVQILIYSVSLGFLACNGSNIPDRELVDRVACAHMAQWKKARRGLAGGSGDVQTDRTQVVDSS